MRVHVWRRWAAVAVNGVCVTHGWRGDSGNEGGLDLLESEGLPVYGGEEFVVFDSV